MCVYVCDGEILIVHFCWCLPLFMFVEAHDCLHTVKCECVGVCVCAPVIAHLAVRNGYCVSVAAS